MADMREPVHQREVGRDLTRIDAGDKTHGRARYPQDLPLPEGCLHLATVRVPTVGARIGEVDTSPALRVPGVVRVLTAEDVGGTNRFGLLESDQPVLAEDRIRGASDVVALVIAESDRAARNTADPVVSNVSDA